MRVVAPAFGYLDILGIADGSGPAHLWRAALEAVTDQAAQIHDAIVRQRSTPDIGRHRGWSRSEGHHSQTPSLRRADKPTSTKPEHAVPHCWLRRPRRVGAGDTPVVAQ
jgi:hypothetical protein